LLKIVSLGLYKVAPFKVLVLLPRTAFTTVEPTPGMAVKPLVICPNVCARSCPIGKGFERGTIGSAGGLDGVVAFGAGAVALGVAVALGAGAVALGVGAAVALGVELNAGSVALAAGAVALGAATGGGVATLGAGAAAFVGAGAAAFVGAGAAALVGAGVGVFAGVLAVAMLTSSSY
jgi:hypothetical protein